MHFRGRRHVIWPKRKWEQKQIFERLYNTLKMWNDPAGGAVAMIWGSDRWSIFPGPCESLLDEPSPLCPEHLGSLRVRGGEEEALNESGQFTPHFTEPQPTGRACSSNELYQTLLSWSSTQPLHLHLGRKAKAIRIKLNQDKNQRKTGRLYTAYKYKMQNTTTAG